MRMTSLLAVALLLLATASPSLAQIVVLSSTTQEREAGPGESYEGEIRIRNAGAEPAELRVGQSDYAFQADGTSRFEEPGTLSRSNAGWVVPTPGEMILAPGEEGEIAYRVAVPEANASADAERAPDAGGSRLHGTYWSVLFLEWIPAGDPESRLASGDDREAEMTIRTRIRHAVQVATHIRDTGEAELGFVAPAARRDEDGEAQFEVVVENRGSTGSRPRISATVFDETGAQVGSREEERGLLYPETSLKQSFGLGDLPAGEYTVLLLADADGDEVFGAQYTLRF